MDVRSAAAKELATREAGCEGEQVEGWWWWGGGDPGGGLPPPQQLPPGGLSPYGRLNATLGCQLSRDL